jgi:serine/threonine protein kinase
LDALRARLLGAREKETQHPKPAQAPGEKTPSRPPSQPPVESVADASHTQLFATRPASVSAPPAISDAHTPAPAASESTILFSVPEPGSAPGQPIAGKDEPPIDTALTISNCAEPTFLGSKVGLQRFPFTIGRGDADWKLFFDAAVSARHAEIDYRQGGFFIRDLNSANGTFLNGQRLPPMRPEALLFGARILLGSNTELVFGSGDLREIPDLRGQLVGNRFTLLEKLHSSPKSVLYLARDENLPRQVVVKLLSPSLINHAGYCEQFSREAHTASLLRHAHICQVIDYGELRLADGSRSLYVCMEYLPGGSLQARLHQSGSIPVDRIALWLEAVCQALSYIHERGVVHAGIKPSAIVFDDSDNACLTDFAFATQLGEGNRHTVIGAPAFLAPEQWDGADLVPATDQYALAVLFYWLTAGALPFEGQEHSAVRLRNLQREPDPVHQMAARNGRPAVPPALSPVFQRALAVRSDQRFPNARDFAAAFRLALIEPAPVRSGPPSVFISYQRAASSAWAVLLKKEMEREQGFQVFLDTEQQDSTGQFPLKLRRRIQECDVFICLLAESTLASDWVRQEIQLASDAAKPMIPVFQESYRDPPNLRTLEPYVQELLTYEGVKLLDRQNIYLDAAIQALIVSTRRTIETAGLRAGTPRPHQAEAAPQKRRAGFARRLRKQLQALIRRLSGE